MTNDGQGSDQRSYYSSLALETISKYESGEISIGVMIHSLDLMWDSLDESEWKEDYRGYWGDLEVTYALALDRGESLTSGIRKAEIEEAITSFKNFLA